MITPRRHQYTLATDEQTNEQTNRQTEGHRRRVKPPLCGGGLKTTCTSHPKNFFYNCYWAQQVGLSVTGTGNL